MAQSMSNSVFFFATATVFVLALCFQSGSSLQCYECNSHNDTRCFLEDLPEELIKPCPDLTKSGKPYTLCRKIKQIIDFEVNGLPPDTRVIRSCGWDDSTYKNKCYHRSGFGGRQEVCACDGDRCNGGGKLLVVTSGALLLLALLFTQA